MHRCRILVAKIIDDRDNKAKLFDEASRDYNISNFRFCQRHASLVQLLRGDAHWS